VLAYDQDGVAPAAPAIRAAGKAPHGQLSYLPGGHYQAFLDGEAQAADVLVSFLHWTLSARTDRSVSEYGAAGEPGVVVAQSPQHPVS